MTLFLATDLDPIEDYEPDPEERIEIVRWPLADLDGAIAECEDSKILIGLLLFQAGAVAALHRQGSRAAGRNRRHGDRRSAGRDRQPTLTSRRSCSTSSPIWSSSAGWPATRSTPTAPTCCSSAAFLAARGGSATEVERADVADFLADLATGVKADADGNGGRAACSPATISRKTACLRSFYRHLRREELIADDPTATAEPAAEVAQAAAGAEPRPR